MFPNQRSGVNDQKLLTPALYPKTDIHKKGSNTLSSMTWAKPPIPIDKTGTYNAAAKTPQKTPWANVIDKTFILFISNSQIPPMNTNNRLGPGYI